MKYQIFHVNSFTNKIFEGNPACVVPLNEWLCDDLLLNIAKENAVPETAFFIKHEREFHLRWFTPDRDRFVWSCNISSSSCYKIKIKIQD